MDSSSSSSPNEGDQEIFLLKKEVEKLKKKVEKLKKKLKRTKKRSKKWEESGDTLLSSKFHFFLTFV